MGLSESYLQIVRIRWSILSVISQRQYFVCQMSSHLAFDLTRFDVGENKKEIIATLGKSLINFRKSAEPQTGQDCKVNLL